MQNNVVIRAINSLLHLLDRVLAFVLGTLAGILALSVIITVFLRYVFGISYAWAEELLVMIFIATTFLGAALGLREKEHITISLFAGGGGKWKKIRNSLAMIAVIIVCAFIFRYSLIWMSKVGSIPSPATGIQYSVFYSLVPISFGISILYALSNILAEFAPVEAARTKSQFEEAGPAKHGEGEPS